MHTKGEADLAFGEYLEKAGEPGCQIAWIYAKLGSKMSEEEARANGKRIEALWNASVGMTTERAVEKLLK